MKWPLYIFLLLISRVSLHLHNEIVYFFGYLMLVFSIPDSELPPLFYSSVLILHQRLGIFFYNIVSSKIMGFLELTISSPHSCIFFNTYSIYNHYLSV